MENNKKPKLSKKELDNRAELLNPKSPKYYKSRIKNIKDEQAIEIVKLINNEKVIKKATKKNVSQRLSKKELDNRAELLNPKSPKFFKSRIKNIKDEQAIEIVKLISKEI